MSFVGTLTGWNHHVFCICFVKTKNVQFVYILQVERNRLYLQDDFSRVAPFSNSLGNFVTTKGRGRTLFEVKGAAEAAGVNCQLPSSQDLGYLQQVPASTALPLLIRDARSTRSPAVPQNAVSAENKILRDLKENLFRRI